jgi:hypothetical protein
MDMLGAMVLGLIVVGAFGGLVARDAFGRLWAFSVLAGLLGLVAVILYGLFQLWDLRRPLPSRPVSARVLFDCLVLGIRRKELGPADGWTALVLLRGFPGLRHPVHHVKLGDGIEVDNLWVFVRLPARAVTEVRFAPDPKEDYIGSEHPIYLCEATLLIASGRQFRLIVTESDAQMFRQWAESKGIAVCDCGGYTPRPLDHIASLSNSQ